MSERVNKIKAHFSKHREAYITGSAGLAIITLLIMRERYAALLQGADGSETITVRPLSFNLFAKESGNVVTTIHNGGRGHPGFRVRNIEHDLIFDTQGAEARAFKIPENVISGHLNKKFDDAYGLHFERIAA